MARELTIARLGIACWEADVPCLTHTELSRLYRSARRLALTRSLLLRRSVRSPRLHSHEALARAPKSYRRSCVGFTRRSTAGNGRAATRASFSHDVSLLEAGIEAGMSDELLAEEVKDSDVLREGEKHHSSSASLAAHRLRRKNTPWRRPRLCKHRDYLAGRIDRLVLELVTRQFSCASGSAVHCRAFSLFDSIRPCRRDARRRSFALDESVRIISRMRVPPYIHRAPVELGRERRRAGGQVARRGVTDGVWAVQLTGEPGVARGVVARLELRCDIHRVTRAESAPGGGGSFTQLSPFPSSSWSLRRFFGHPAIRKGHLQPAALHSTHCTQPEQRCVHVRSSPRSAFSS